MVQRIFTAQRSSDSATGWKLVDTQDQDHVVDLPSYIFEVLEDGVYIKDANIMLDKISTLQIALAGITDGFNIVDQFSFDRRSELKSFGLKPNGTIDDTIDFYLKSVKEYEKFHTLKMDRDIKGDDDSIHAYIETPTEGRIRSRFSKQNGIRLDSKRNNIDYWLDDYKIVSGSAGGKSVVPIGDPIEIMR